MGQIPRLQKCFSLVATCVFFVSLISAQDAISTITTALHAHDYQQAAELTRAAIQQSPSDPQLWMLQGVALAGLGNKQEALASFHSALKLAPNHLPALQQEAQLYYEAGDLAGVPVLDHILRLKPGDPMSHAMIDRKSTRLNSSHRCISYAVFCLKKKKKKMK